MEASGHGYAEKVKNSAFKIAPDGGTKWWLC
jgi:hypothetical protein